MQGALGTDESLNPPADGPGPHKFLMLHEWESLVVLGTEEYKAAISTPCTLKFKGIAMRLFKLHKAWDRK